MSWTIWGRALEGGWKIILEGGVENHSGGGGGKSFWRGGWKIILEGGVENHSGGGGWKIILEGGVENHSGGGGGKSFWRGGGGKSFSRPTSLMYATYAE